VTSRDVRRRDRLWELLPEFHRLRDAEAGYPLRALLGATGKQFARVETDIENLWNDFFIETCEPWVVPYIADLVGIEPIHDVDGTARVDVARTIRFRKRQGTLPMLEDLATKVTGWDTVVAEMFRRIAWTQHLNHQDAARTMMDLRNQAPLQLIDRAFDPHIHTADLREPSVARARANISNFAFFVHRLDIDPLGDRFGGEGTPLEVTPRPLTNSANEGRFFLHPLGIDTPMFHRDLDDENRSLRTDEHEAPAAIRTGWLASHLVARRGNPDSGVLDLRAGALKLTGDDKSEGLDWLTVQCADLSDWAQPPPGTVYLDPQSARLTMSQADRQADLGGPLSASFATGTPGSIGATGRDRSSSDVYVRRPRTQHLSSRHEDRQVWLPSPDDDDPEGWTVLKVGAEGSFGTLNDALAAWPQPEGDQAKTLIRVTDSGTYEENLTFVPRSNSHLVVQAKDGQRPFIAGNIRLIGGASSSPVDDRMRLSIDGVWVDGSVRVTAGAAVDEIEIIHSTVRPLEHTEQGASAAPDKGIVLRGSVNALRVTHSAVWGVETSSATDLVAVEDSIVDGHGGAALSGEGGLRSGPATVADRTTFVGAVLVREIDASDCVFVGLLEARRTQVGCIRYSFVPSGVAERAARTPRRYRCQPDLAHEEVSVTLGRVLDSSERLFVERAVTPQFQTLNPFDPHYAVLLPDAPEEIRLGAEEGLEMGAWNLLRNPHRLENLRRRIVDYLPFGLRPELIYVN
jgi:hypothetical protein